MKRLLRSSLTHLSRSNDAQYIYDCTPAAKKIAPITAVTISTGTTSNKQLIRKGKTKLSSSDPSSSSLRSVRLRCAACRSSASFSSASVRAIAARWS
jgi:hypothetical protein